MKYNLKTFNRNIPDDELLDDLKRVAKELGAASISSREYNDNGGKFTAGTIGMRFGTWNNALTKAGLHLVNQRYVSAEALFENLEQVWITLGRQPVFRDMKGPISRYSTHQYVAKFGKWQDALLAFVEYINAEDTQLENEILEVPKAEIAVAKEEIFKHKTKRFPSERLKVQVLMRDGNKCRLCGLTVIGENIHFDHIIPWSKGGETVLENLQVLCEKHNLAKGDIQP